MVLAQNLAISDTLLKGPSSARKIAARIPKGILIQSGNADHKGGAQDGIAKSAHTGRIKGTGRKGVKKLQGQAFAAPEKSAL